MFTTETKAQMSPNPAAWKKPGSGMLDGGSRDEFISQARADGLTWRAIGAHLGCTDDTARKYALRAGVRTAGPAKPVAPVMVIKAEPKPARDGQPLPAGHPIAMAVLAESVEKWRT